MLDVRNMIFFKHLIKKKKCVLRVSNTNIVRNIHVITSLFEL